eukprot:721787-Prorocentrum_minimum.AAC.5
MNGHRWTPTFPCVATSLKPNLFVARSHTSRHALGSSRYRVPIAGRWLAVPRAIHHAPGEHLRLPSREPYAPGKQRLLCTTALGLQNFTRDSSRRFTSLRIFAFTPGDTSHHTENARKELLVPHGAGRSSHGTPSCARGVRNDSETALHEERLPGKRLAVAQQCANKFRLVTCTTLAHVRQVDLT